MQPAPQTAESRNDPRNLTKNLTREPTAWAAAHWMTPQPRRMRTQPTRWNSLTTMGWSVLADSRQSLTHSPECRTRLSRHDGDHASSRLFRPPAEIVDQAYRAAGTPRGQSGRS